MGYFRKIAAEPSTAAGAAILAVLLGQYAGAEAMSAASPIAAAIFAAWSIFKPESGK